MATFDPEPLPLDEHGRLCLKKLELPSRREAYTVFAQQKDARIDVAAWQRNARSYFDSSIDLTLPEADDGSMSEINGARVSVEEHGQSAVIRSVFVRPRLDEDLSAAEAAERGGAGTGLSLLAKRCGIVVLVVTESDSDAAALFLSAVIASAVLGPILTPGQDQLWGLNTARRMLAGMR
jgi:hypothetical protein